MIPTPQQLEIRDLARDFAEGELRPRSAEWDARRALDDSVFGQLAELGFLGMLVPERYGGLELDLGSYLLVIEELAHADAAVALSVGIHNGAVASLLLAHGSEAQRERWLPRLASGEILGAFALSEPRAGSDAGSVATSAEPVGDGWRLTGTKRWVTNGARAGLVVTFARTGPGELGAFLVEPGAKGYAVVGRETTMGLRASETVTVQLDDVAVAADALVGDPAEGLVYGLEALDLSRLGIAAQAVGVGRAALEHATRYALEREQFGSAIATFGAIQAKLAEMTRRLAGARALTHAGAAALEASRNGRGHGRTGPDGVTARAAIAKLDASEAAVRAADEAIQVFGGYGYMREYPVEKLLRDAKGMEIYDGTNEIMRYVIARELLRAEEED